MKPTDFVTGTLSSSVLLTESFLPTPTGKSLTCDVPINVSLDDPLLNTTFACFKRDVTRSSSTRASV